MVELQRPIAEQKQTNQLPDIQGFKDNDLALTGSKVPVGISARHIHLSQADIDILFGEGYTLKKFKNLYQEKEFAAKETLTVVGPKGTIEEVRIIGPARKKSQIEISKTDAIKLGINAPIRESGKLLGSPGCVLIGPKNILSLTEGVIIPAAHIHINPVEAGKLNLANGSTISVTVPGERSLTFNKILVRVKPEMKLEMHIDTDEANAALIKNGETAFIQSQQFLH